MFDLNAGKLFDDVLMAEVKNRFYHVDVDPVYNQRRLFFDNAGGSFRLKAAADVHKKIDDLPDCPEHSGSVSEWMKKIRAQAIDNLKMMVNGDAGSMVTSYTASMVMFDVTETIIANVPGTNVVTTMLEHPSAYDSAEYYAKKHGKEFRVAKTNKITGGVDVEEITRLVDKDTCLLSVIFASNISGAILDMENIVRECRKINPELYIVIDSVQHAPHGLIDLKKCPVDSVSFAPYKFFGVRGLGVGFISERVAKLPHHKLTADDIDSWELGSPSGGHYAALSEIANYVCWLGSQFTDSKDRRVQFEEGMNAIKLHERALINRLLNGTDGLPGLRNIPGVNVYLDYEDLTRRDFIMAIGFDNLGDKQAVAEYDKRNVVVFERVATSYYSERMLRSFDMEGCVRIAPLHCNTIEDMNQFLRVTAEIAKL